MSVKLQDVAKKAGVSITTCSLILNNKPINITDDTKKAVLNAAQELGYIRKNKVPNIGLIVPDLENLYYTEVVKKLSLKAREKNHNLVIMDSDNDLNQELINVNTMLHTDIDGLIMALIPSEENLNQLRPVFRDFMERKHIPVIIMDSNYPSLNCHSICVNNYYGGYLATEHLVKCGHTRIGHITGSIHHKEEQDSTKGYRTVFAEHHLPFCEQWIYNGDFTMQTGYQAAPVLLEQNVTAIFAQNDMIALGVYQYLREHNLRVPEDISLIGFDDISFINSVGIPLTTIAKPTSQIAERCMNILFEQTMISPAEDRITLTLQPSLVVRNSTCPFKG